MSALVSGHDSTRAPLCLTLDTTTIHDCLLLRKTTKHQPRSSSISLNHPLLPNTDKLTSASNNSGSMIRPTLTTQEIAIDLFTFLQEAPHTSSVYSPPIDTPSEPPQRPSPTRQWSGDTFAWWLEVDAVPDLILPNFDFELERESDGSTTCSPISNLSVLLAEEDGAPGETQSISLKAFLKEEADEDEDGAEGHHGPVAGFRDFVWGCGDIYGQSDHRQMCISPISSCRDLYSDHNTHSATMPYISTDRRISTSGTTPEKQEKMQRGEEGVILTFEAFLAEFPGSLSPRRTRSLGGAWKRAREVMKRVKV